MAVSADKEGIKPVVSDFARRWLQGELSSRDYFQQAREKATERARADVERRLRKARSAPASSG